MRTASSREPEQATDQENLDLIASVPAASAMLQWIVTTSHKGIGLSSRKRRAPKKHVWISKSPGGEGGSCFLLGAFFVPSLLMGVRARAATGREYGFISDEVSVHEGWIIFCSVLRTGKANVLLKKYVYAYIHCTCAGMANTTTV